MMTGPRSGSRRPWAPQFSSEASCHCVSPPNTNEHKVYVAHVARALYRMSGFARETSVLRVYTQPGAIVLTLPRGAILTISFLSVSVRPYIIPVLTNGTDQKIQPQFHAHPMSTIEHSHCSCSYHSWSPHNQHFLLRRTCQRCFRRARSLPCPLPRTMPALDA